MFGIIKPFIKGMKRLHFILAFFISAVLLVVAASFVDTKSDKTSQNTAKKSKTENSQKPEEKKENTQETKAKVEESQKPSDKKLSNVPSRWVYREKKDEMRESLIQHATTRTVTPLSVGGIQLYPKLDIRKISNSSSHPEISIMLSIDLGSIMCDDNRGDEISVKFDNSPIQKFACSRTTSGEDNVIFLLSEDEFFQKLKNSQKLIVELPLLQLGMKQFTFDTAGLNL